MESDLGTGRLIFLLPLAHTRAGSWPTLTLTPVTVVLVAIVVLDFADSEYHHSSGAHLRPIACRDAYDQPP
jgi:hypothetical protein